MRILHVVQTLDPEFGGPARVALELASEQALGGHEVCLVAARTSARSLADSREKAQGLTITELDVLWRPILYCRRLFRTMWRATSNAEVVHVHGAYRLVPTAAAWIARLRHRPLVTRPHGTYDAVLRDQASHNVRVRSLYEQVLEWPLLRSKRTVVQCTSRAEEAQLRSVVPGVTNVVVVGNAVATPRPSPSREAARSQFRLSQDDFLLLYLGRIARKKRLDILLSAFDRARRDEPRLRLVIAGPDPEDLRDALGRSHGDSGLVWAGHVDGAEREALFRAADAFILTSGGENFGVAAVEAAARRLPLILTREVAAADLFDHRSCCFPSLEVDSIVSAILELTGKTPSARQEMGRAAEDVWRSQACWETILPQLLSAYALAEAL